MLLCGFYSDCTVRLKSKLPVASRFLCDENPIAQESSNQKANFNIYLHVAEVKLCSRVSHSKALPSILEIAEDYCGHDTKLMYLLFLGRHALGKLRPVLLESRNVRCDSRLARGW